MLIAISVLDCVSVCPFKLISVSRVISALAAEGDLICRPVSAVIDRVTLDAVLDLLLRVYWQSIETVERLSVLVLAEIEIVVDRAMFVRLSV